MTTKTKSQDIAGDVAALLRARTPLLWIITTEEERVERYLVEAAASAAYEARTWDVAAGIASVGERPDPNYRDPGAAMDAIGAMTGRRSIWIMRDLPAWITGQGGATTLRQLRNLARSLPTKPRDSAQAVVILTPSAEVPPELAGNATVIDWPLPDRDEIAATLDAAIDVLPDEIKAQAAPNGTRDAAIDAAVGLSGLQAQGCFAKSLVTTRKIDPATVAAEKKRIVAASGVLEWIDPIKGGLKAVGGLDNLKSYLFSRAAAYTPEARAYGLPLPMGSLVVGWNGCGKSLITKAVATAWQQPLLRVDMGAAKSKFVGDSEQTIRQAFDVVAAIGRCVLWFDEIEKMFSSATEGGADGGVSKDQLGFLLTWMQEKRGQAFVVATSNDVTALPPELMRRFDVTWWIDLPTLRERVEIIGAAMQEHGRDPASIDGGDVAAATEGFSGAEIAGLVPSALYAGFADGKRPITTADLMAAAAVIVPGSKTNAEKLARMRQWAEGRARRATSEEQTKRTTARQLNL